MSIKAKLNDIYELVSSECQPIAESLITELSFIVDTLETLRESVNNNGPVEEYVNGTQVLTRQSPAFKGYYALIPKYNALIKELIGLIPEAVEEKPESALEKFLNEFPYE